MHVFIDESGTFSHPGTAGAMAAVGALAIPSAQLPLLESEYAALRPTLRKDDRGEVKGKCNGPEQIASVVDLLRRFDVLFEVEVVDLGRSDADKIEAHRKSRVRRLNYILAQLPKEVSAEHLVDLQQSFGRMRDVMQAMTSQLFVQGIMMVDLVARILSVATCYYSQRMPKELGSFHWVVDGHDKTRITEFEHWWQEFVLPMLQKESAQQPPVQFGFEDYSAFQRYQAPMDPTLLAKIAEHRGEDIEYLRSRVGLQNISMIFGEDFRFSSAPEAGLELVDILTNAVRRSLRGNLSENGWQNIPRLMVDRPWPYPYFTLFAENDSGGADVALVPNSQFPYGSAIEKYFLIGKQMFTPDSVTTLRLGGFRNPDYWRAGEAMHKPKSAPSGK